MRLKIFFLFGFVFAQLFWAFGAWAQRGHDSANTVAIQILNTRTGTFTQTETGGVNKLVGDVLLQQGGTSLACDSAILDVDRNNVEAFGSVHIIQPGGTEVESDYLRYTGNTRMAYLRGAVALTDGTNNLWSEVLTYDLGSKIGNYTDGGTLQSGETVLSSRRGTYNLRSKDARFIGEVIVNNPRYDVISDDLGYNTEKKVVRFYGPSIVTNDKSELRTTRGTWDERREVAHFNARSSIWSSDQYVEADTMDYDRKTGFGLARGEVFALDTAQQITLWSRYAAYNENQKTLLAAIKPVLRRISGEDSIFIAADTFLSAPDIREAVVLNKAALKDGSGKNDSARKPAVKPKAPRRVPAPAHSDTLSRRPPPVFAPVPVTIEDSTAADTAKARYFIGYRHVRVFSDSLQAICDSIRYTQRDSALRLIRDPVAWSRSGQISGDTIVLVTDSGKIRSLWVPNNALMVSRSGPEKANLFDQVQGKTLTGLFDEGALREMVVWPEAESIYFATDDDGAYIGVNESQGDRMRIFFRESKIRRILIEQNPKQTMTPLNSASLAGLRLSRFVWREKEKPKSREELFR
jgi:lipopolysaccharide export system protein LptA